MTLTDGATAEALREGAPAAAPVAVLPECKHRLTITIVDGDLADIRRKVQATGDNLSMTWLWRIANRIPRDGVKNPPTPHLTVARKIAQALDVSVGDVYEYLDHLDTCVAGQKN